MSFLSLLFRFRADNSEFVSKVRESNQSIDGFAGKLRNLGKIIGIGALGLQIKQAVDLGSHLKDLQDRLDLNAEALQNYANSARRTGSDIGEVAAPFDKLRKNIGTSLGNGQSSEEMRKRFENLGVTFDDLRAREPEEIFNMLLDKMASGTMTAQQFADATEILGKAWSKLIPLAKDLAEHKKDLLFSQEEIDQLDEAGDAFSDLWNNIKVFTGKGLIGVKGFFEDFVSAFFINANDLDEMKTQEANEEAEKKAGDKSKLDAIKEQARLQEEADQAAEAKAKAHMATMDRITQMEEEAGKLSEQARTKGLTEEERLNELLEERFRLLAEINGIQRSGRTDDAAQEQITKDKRDLAKTELDIANTKALPQDKQDHDAAARSGLFIGGRHDPLVDINQQHLNVAIEMKEILTSIDKGISKKQSLVD